MNFFEDFHSFLDGRYDVALGLQICSQHLDGEAHVVGVLFPPSEREPMAFGLIFGKEPPVAGWGGITVQVKITVPAPVLRVLPHLVEEEIVVDDEPAGVRSIRQASERKRERSNQ